MVDLHTHSLHQIDDGAKNLDMALEMVLMQQNQGVSTIVCTPHYHPSKQSIEDFVISRDQAFDTLSRALLEHRVDVKLLKASEVMYASTLDLNNLDALVIENTRYILIECDPSAFPLNLVDDLQYVIDSGYIPILAHIERYRFLRDHLDLMVTLVERGVIFQMNASTILDQKQRSFVKACFKHHLIHCIASDSHRSDLRKPNLALAYDEIRNHFGNTVEITLRKNAQMIIENKRFDIDSPTVIRRLFKKYY